MYRLICINGLFWVMNQTWAFRSVMCSVHFYWVDLIFPPVEASVHSSNAHCTDKTIEAAEALLHMESPTCLRDSRSPGMWTVLYYSKDSMSFHVSRIKIFFLIQGNCCSQSLLYINTCDSSNWSFYLSMFPSLKCFKYLIFKIIDTEGAHCRQINVNCCFYNCVSFP